MHKVSAKFSWSCLYTVARTQEGNKIYKQNLCNYIHLITEHSASNEEHLIKAPRSQLSLCHSFMSWFNIQPPKPNTQASTDAQTQTVLQSSKLFFFFFYKTHLMFCYLPSSFTQYTIFKHEQIFSKQARTGRQSNHGKKKARKTRSRGHEKEGEKHLPSSAATKEETAAESRSISTKTDSILQNIL